MDVETLERMGFERGMVRTLATYWWMLLLRGLALRVRKLRDAQG